MNSSFDHRSSIVRYLDEQADAYDKAEQSSDATITRALASNVRARLDVKVGIDGIVSAVRVIIEGMCVKFVATNYREVVGESQTKGVIRTRFAAIWVAKKRTAWSDGRLASEFNRDPSTIHSALKRAEEFRTNDPEFRAITDAGLDHDPRCEQCQYPLIFA